MSKKINIGVIGAGENTKKFHIPNFQKLENVEVIGVCNRSYESGKKVADEFSIDNVYSNWMDLIEDKDIDAICIGTWPYMHEVLVCESLKNNKHVMTEARMTFDYESAKRMLEFSKKSPNLISQIVPAPMTLKFDKYIRKLIGQNEIGEVIQVDISINHQTPISLSGGYPDFNSENHWRSDIDLSGMNTMQLGIWYEAMMRWVGSAKNVMSSSDLIVKTKKENDDYSFVKIPDNINVIGELEIGGLYNIKMSTVKGNAPKDSVWIYGTKGTIQLDCVDYELYIADETNDFKKVSVPNEFQSWWRVEEEFVNSIRGEEKITHTTFEIGLKYMEFVEAVRKSDKNGTRIELFN